MVGGSNPPVGASYFNELEVSSLISFLSDDSLFWTQHSDVLLHLAMLGLLTFTIKSLE
jgi:hypothetical protein